MEIDEIYGYLCVEDPRNPQYFWEEGDDVTLPRQPKCYCDNCFYGRDQLVMEILRLRGERGEDRELPKV